MTESSQAVFLSYASEDFAAAERIAVALRAAGIEVWFDRTELRGGDAWDQRIRKQIKSCVLFIPVISRHTHEREEGYFRLEWKLAVDRSHLMTSNKTFLLPVVIDDTREDDENVPDRFKDIHWTRLPGGETPPVFVERVRRLVSPEPSREPSATSPVVGSPPSVKERLPASFPSRWTLLAIVAVVGSAALAYFVIDRFMASKHAPLPPAPLAAPATATAAAFSPPPHSIAVLPFVNMSGDKDQEYFSDGLSEELLNDLARINELQVAGRTSSFYFKGKDVDLGTIARKLNVGAVLEGSVRRSTHTVRVTAQLVNGVTGFHLWSQTYDRNLGDVLQLQTEIATAVASALKVTLLGDEAAKIELGGTRNPKAFDAYLRASKLWFMQHGDEDAQAAIASYDEAIRLDPQYSLAFADRALALTGYAGDVPAEARHIALDKALADARRAIDLAPGLMESHRALAFVLENSLDFGPAAKEYERALALNPGNARLLRIYGGFAVNMGWAEAGLAALRHGVVLDPLSRNQHRYLAAALYALRRYDESTAAFRDALAIDPDDAQSSVLIGINYFMLGNYQSARSWCEAKSTDKFSSACLAIVYDKLGRHSDAEAALAKFKGSFSDILPYTVATIYAQWGDTARALEWLEKAMRLRDPDLEGSKTDALFDLLRQDPRFQAIQRELKFPD